MFGFYSFSPKGLISETCTEFFLFEKVSVLNDNVMSIIYLGHVWPQQPWEEPLFFDHCSVTSVSFHCGCTSRFTALDHALSLFGCCCWIFFLPFFFFFSYFTTFRKMQILQMKLQSVVIIQKSIISLKYVKCIWHLDLVTIQFVV